jgi:hypothetical protein
VRRPGGRRYPRGGAEVNVACARAGGGEAAAAAAREQSEDEVDGEA